MLCLAQTKSLYWFGHTVFCSSRSILSSSKLTVFCSEKSLVFHLDCGSRCENLLNKLGAIDFLKIETSIETLKFCHWDIKHLPQYRSYDNLKYLKLVKNWLI